MQIKRLDAVLQGSRRGQRTVGSKIHQAVHEGTCEADLGRTCPNQEEEAIVVQERRRAKIPIQGEQILSIDLGSVRYEWRGSKLV